MGKKAQEEKGEKCKGKDLSPPQQKIEVLRSQEKEEKKISTHSTQEESEQNPNFNAIPEV